MKKIAGTAFVLLWLLTIVLVLLWDQNLVSILACALGFAAALLVVLRLRWWRPVGGSASLLFVANWASAFVSSDANGSSFGTYVSGIEQAAKSQQWMDSALVLGYEVVLPLLHLVVALVLMAGLVKKNDA